MKARQFIVENQDLLKENRLKEFYDAALKSIPKRNEVGQLTQFFIENGVNPLLYMDEIPIDYAFNLKNTQINIPPQIKKINPFSFYGFENDSLFIPEGVVKIQNNSFNYSKINKIHFPKSLKYIGSDTFESSTIKEIEYAGNMEE